MKVRIFYLLKLFVLTAVGYLLAGKTILATPSTIIWIPSADFQRFDSWHLGIDNFIRIHNKGQQPGAGIYDLGITTGISPFKKIQAEVGIDYLSMGDAIYDVHPFYFNGKIGYPEGSLFKNAPAVVIGGYNLGLKKELTNYNVVYSMIAKTLYFIGRISAGYYIGNRNILVDQNGVKTNSGLLLSWDRPMKEISDKLSLAVDYQGGKNFMGSTNIGISWAFSEKISVIVGYDIYNNHRVMYNSKDVNQNAFTTQLDINF